MENYYNRGNLTTIEMVRLILPSLFVLFQLEYHFILPLTGIKAPAWLGDYALAFFLSTFLSIFCFRIFYLFFFAAYWILSRLFTSLLSQAFMQHHFDIADFHRHMIAYMRAAQNQPPPELAEMVAWGTIIALDIVAKAKPFKNSFEGFLDRLTGYGIHMTAFVVHLFLGLCLVILVKHFLFVRR